MKIDWREWLLQSHLEDATEEEERGAVRMCGGDLIMVS
jgi:hypothetical protein